MSADPGRLHRRGLLGGLLAAAALASLPRPARADKPLLLVLTSDATPRTEAIVAAFKAATEGATRVSYELGPEVDAAAFLADGTRDMSVSAVFALGDRAFAAAAREFAAAPLIYADVADLTPGEGRANVIGLSLRADPAAALDRLVAALPRLDTLGLLRSSRDADNSWWEALAAQATARGIRLETRSANGGADIPNALTALLSRADVVWPQPDPRLWTGAVISRALHDALLARKPMLGLDRAWLTGPEPSPLVVETSARGVGQSAGAAARRLVGLGDGPAAGAWPEPWLVGSKQAWRALGMNLRKETAERVDEWID